MWAADMNIQSEKRHEHTHAMPWFCETFCTYKYFLTVCANGYWITRTLCWTLSFVYDTHDASGVWLYPTSTWLGVMAVTLPLYYEWQRPGSHTEPFEFLARTVTILQKTTSITALLFTVIRTWCIIRHPVWTWNQRHIERATPVV
jgi:hypothetical protein